MTHNNKGGGPSVQANGMLANAVIVLRHIIDSGNNGEHEIDGVELVKWRVFTEGTILKLVRQSANHSYLKQEHMGDVQKLSVGKEFEFFKLFPGLPIGDGDLPPRHESEEHRKTWINNIWKDSGEEGMVRISSMEDLFKVYLVICGFRMKDVSELMRSKELSLSMPSFKEAEEELWKFFECANQILRCCIDFNRVDDRKIVDMYQEKIMSAFMASPGNFENLKNNWETLVDPGQNNSLAVIRKCLQRYHQWLELRLYSTSTRLPLPPVSTEQPHMLTPIFGSQAERTGYQIAPPKAKRSTNNTQVAPSKKATGSGVRDDLTSGGSQTGNSVTESPPKILAGDVKGGLPCYPYFDSGQSYTAGMAKSALDEFEGLRGLVQNYEELAQPRLVRTAGDSVAFFVVAQGVVKFNFFFGSTVRWLIVDALVYFMDQPQRLVSQSDLRRVTFGARFLRSFKGGLMCTDGIRLAWIPGPKCKKDAENDRLGALSNHNLPCELRDADPHEREMMTTLLEDQIAEWKLNQGDELIEENFKQEMAYENYLTEGDALMQLVSAGLVGEETISKETDTDVVDPTLREFFSGVSAQYPPRLWEGLASMLAAIFPGASIEQDTGLAQPQPICKETGVFKYHLQNAADGSSFKD